MLKQIQTTLILILAVFSCLPAWSFFLDWDYFTKRSQVRHERTVVITNHDDCPIQIKEASVHDEGSYRFKDLNDVFDTFTAEVKNLSDKKVLSYKIRWTMKHPFENFVYKQIVGNSVNSLDPGKEQELMFKKDRYFRDDTYYYVDIEEVQFIDEELWEAPDTEFVKTDYDKVLDEIESIKEVDAVNGALMMLQEGVNGSSMINGAELIKGQ